MPPTMPDQPDDPAPRSFLGSLFAGVWKSIALFCLVLIPALAAGIKVYEFGRDTFVEKKPATTRSAEDRELRRQRRAERRAARRMGPVEQPPQVIEKTETVVKYVFVVEDESEQEADGWR